MRSSKRGAEVVWTLKSEVPNSKLSPSCAGEKSDWQITKKIAQHPVPHRQPEPWSLSTCLHKAVVPLVGVHAILGDMVDICRYGHMARMGQDCLRERLLATHRASTSHHR